MTAFDRAHAEFRAYESAGGEIDGEAHPFLVHLAEQRLEDARLSIEECCKLLGDDGAGFDFALLGFGHVSADNWRRWLNKLFPVKPSPQKQPAPLSATEVQ